MANLTRVWRVGTVVLALALIPGVSATQPGDPQPSRGLLDPDAPEVNRRAPGVFDVQFETSKGTITIEVHRDWAPLGADRFYNLVEAGYYDDVRFSRVIKGQWAQFGINGDPAVAKAWRDRPIADDPRIVSNVRGTVVFAYAVPNGRTTQVFVNLRDNSASHDDQLFAPFGRVTLGMEVVDRLYSDYGESAGSGIRSGKQGPIFEGGNAYLAREFPNLDYIIRARVTRK